MVFELVGFVVDPNHRLLRLRFLLLHLHLLLIDEIDLHAQRPDLGDRSVVKHLRVWEQCALCVKRNMAMIF